MDESTASAIITWLSAHPIFSGFIIFLIALTESLAVIGILVPGILLMLIIGAYIATGQFSFLTASLLAFAGAVIGDAISYYLGYHYKDKLILVWPINRYPAAFERGVQFFKRHGNKSVVLGRFIGPIRAFIPAIAGMFQMPRTQFFISNILSAAIWAPMVLLPGYIIGLSLALAGDVAGRLIIYVIIIGILLWFIIWLLKVIVLSMLSHLNKGLNTLFNKNKSTKIVFKFSRKVNIFILVLLSVLLLKTFPIHSPSHNILIVEQNIWQEHLWNKLAFQRQGFITKIVHPFNLQFSGTKESIVKNLNESGWQSSAKPQISNILQLLNPQASIMSLAIFPHTHNGVTEQLRFIQEKKNLNELLIIRLWKTDYKIKQFNPEHEARPLWQGTLTKLVIVEQLGLKILRSDLVDDAQLSKLALTLEKNNHNIFLKHNISKKIYVLLTSL